MKSPKEQYTADFITPKDRKLLALERAWQTRNFEIELYWKRATYFWTMIGVLFAGYAVAISKSGDDVVALTLACVGFVLGLAWYLVNRASSAWQKNWEAHIDALEDSITGPLYKTVYAPEESYRLHHLFGPLNMSPSKLTVAVAFCITATWLGLIAYSLPASWNPLICLGWKVDPRGVILAGALVSSVALIRFCRTGGGSYKLGFNRRKVDW